MKTFYEYFQGNPIMKPRLDGTSKDPNRVLDRKHSNTINKEYSHKHRLVDQIVNGPLKVKRLNSEELKSVTSAYNVPIEAGEKVLGNSGVMITIKPGAQGNFVGVLKKR